MKLSISLAFGASLFAGLFVVLFSGSANATLGEKASSIASDVVQLKVASNAKRQLRAGDGLGVYSVDETTTLGYTLRQYIASDGTVFAIAWSGSTDPDISVLLGAFGDRYNQAFAKTFVARRAHAREIKADGLVVRQSGHMRSWHGQIIATDLLPSGVTAEDIQ